MTRTRAPQGLGTHAAHPPTGPCRRRTRAPLWTLGVTLFLPGCDILDPDLVCTEEMRYGVNVTVVDAGSGSPITEGLGGTLTEGSFSEVMAVWDNRLMGAGERAGTYTVQVQATGYADWTRQGVVVLAGECHVEPAALTAELTLTPAT
ncbi:MAG: carboxypeptidase-like regulatory domain-containing protein [Gemmatimonadota bacterium]|nr:carboxypeptidase-like regulatory domain-containing protein [Gemmatimonadota bacterium]